MNEHQVQRVWSCLKREKSIVIGYVRAYLAECANENWLAVITDSSWEETEVLVLKTRITAVKRIRERGFLTRMRRIYPQKGEQND
ncbi:hypothetical protein [Paenisporosarcina sp. HGH0030]|uniref:hypothetical protein n=1 Tax=Paenisporosarcina sp. HGH0030 TaxID=1078085 RepID=UPI001E3AAFE5|nr:hypothetical protein [Paenisporosarcina sp. HGH0030]